MKKVIFAGLVSFFLATLGMAETNDDPNFWYGFFNKTELDSQFTWSTETQLRYNGDAHAMGQTLVRTGLLIPIEGSESKSEFGLLYAFVHTGLTKEHRLALQHSMSYSSFLDGLSHRIRYEFRTLEVGGGLSDRFRYLLRFQGPVIIRQYQLVTWNEVFVNIEKGPADEIHHLDRNRFFLGLRLPFEKLSMEIGYLNQWAPRNTISQVDHTATFYLFF